MKMNWTTARHSKWSCGDFLDAVEAKDKEAMAKAFCDAIELHSEYKPEEDE